MQLVVYCLGCSVVFVLAGSSLSYNDYNYDNSNTNVSSHLCLKIFSNTDHAHMAKKYSLIKWLWYPILVEKKTF